MTDNTHLWESRQLGADEEFVRVASPEAEAELTKALETQSLLEDYLLNQMEHLTNAMFEISVQGYKKTHWCWYFFPNMPGLGTSERAKHFAVDLETYMKLLEDSQFRRNIFMMMVAVDRAYRNSDHMDLEHLLGDNPVDVLKWRSFLTLTWLAYNNMPGPMYDWEPEVVRILKFAESGYGWCEQTYNHYKDFKSGYEMD